MALPFFPASVFQSSVPMDCISGAYSGNGRERRFSANKILLHLEWGHYLFGEQENKMWFFSFFVSGSRTSPTTIAILNLSFMTIKLHFVNKLGEYSLLFLFLVYCGGDRLAIISLFSGECAASPDRSTR
jgi:hypothetical protein